MIFNQLHPPDTDNIKELRMWCYELTDTLRFIFENLDEQNVKKAASVDITSLNDESLDITGLKVWTPNKKFYMEFGDYDSSGGQLRVCDENGNERFSVYCIDDSAAGTILRCGSYEVDLVDVVYRALMGV